MYVIAIGQESKCTLSLATGNTAQIIEDYLYYWTPNFSKFRTSISAIKPFNEIINNDILSAIKSLCFIVYPAPMRLVVCIHTN